MKKSRRQSNFVTPRNALKGHISFTFTPSQEAGHSLSERQKMTEKLIDLFCTIKLMGDFNLMQCGRVTGSPDLAGLTLGPLGSRNNILLGYQPGGNDTRFQYSLSLPPHLVTDAYLRLREALEVTSSKSVNLEPLPYVSRVEEADHEVMVASLPRVIEAVTAYGTDLIMIEFDEYVTNRTDGLDEALREILLKHGMEGVFTVKQGIVSAGHIDSLGQGIVWCSLQPGARGLGFWYRDSREHDWGKFSLVPDAQFDLGELAQELVPVKHVPQTTIGQVFTSMRGVSQDYIDDVSLRTTFIAAMATHMLSRGIHAVPTPELTKLFSDTAGEILSGKAVGNVMKAWSDGGFLRVVPKQSAVQTYALGLKSAPVLPESAQGLIGKHIYSRAEAHEERPVAAPLQHLRVQTSSFVGTGDPLADALAKIGEFQARVERATAVVAQYQNDVRSLAELDGEIDTFESKIKELLDHRKALQLKREALVAQMPTAAQITELTSF